MSRRTFYAGLAVFVVVVAAAAFAYLQWTAVPPHVADVQQWREATPQAQQLELAKQVEMRLPSQYTRRIEPGTDGQRTLDATFEEINAWLGQRLEPFLANQGVRWPKDVGALLVTQRDGQLVLAADVNLPQLSQIISVYFDILTPQQLADARLANQPANQPTDPETSPDGATSPDPPWALKVDRITAGNVSLPRARLANLLREQLGEQAEHPRVAEFLEALEQDQAVPLPELRVDRVRRATVTGLSITPTGLTGSMRVWRPEPAASPTGASVGSAGGR